MFEVFKRKVRRPSAGTTIGTMALVAALGRGAYAAIPSDDGTIKACYAVTDGLLLGIPHSKGDLRAVDQSEACRSYEKSVSWNQGGPPPPPPSVRIRSAGGGLPQGERFGSVIARCGAGEVATGGGFRSSNDPRIDDSEPVDDGNGTPVGWRVGISRNPSQPLDPIVVAWAVCAHLG